FRTGGVIAAPFRYGYYKRSRAGGQGDACRPASRVPEGQQLHVPSRACSITCVQVGSPQARAARPNTCGLVQGTASQGTAPREGLSRKGPSTDRIPSAPAGAPPRP